MLRLGYTFVRCHPLKRSRQQCVRFDSFTTGFNRHPTLSRQSAVIVGLGASLVATGGFLLSYSSRIYLDASASSSPVTSGVASSTHSLPEAESLSSLIRAYIVYTACSMPLLVDHAPKILATLDAIPVLRNISSTLIRYTFFNQFVGGETAADTFPLLRQLRNEDQGALLVYSAEVSEDGRHGTSDDRNKVAYQYRIEEVERCIDAAADFEAQQLALGQARGRTWVAIKLSALLPSADSIKRLSEYLITTRLPRYLAIPFPHSPSSTDLDVLAPSARSGPPSPLTTDDLKDLNELYRSLRNICAQAKEKGVTVVIDAEHSWYQLAIDSLTLALSREFNRPTDVSFRPQTPLVYGTYQAYLRRGLPHLKLALAEAKREGYMLGVKLVRGAYQELEVGVWNRTKVRESENGAVPPVWTSKDESDETFDECARILIESLKNDRLKNNSPVLGVVFATHNRKSCEVVMDHLLSNQLATDLPLRRPLSSDAVSGTAARRMRLSEDMASRFSFAQLLGMRDELTEYIAESFETPVPIVMKYIPYGMLDDVIPYLARRAVENKSVLSAGSSGEDVGGASQERRRVWNKLMKKVFR